MQTECLCERSGHCNVLNRTPQQILVISIRNFAGFRDKYLKMRFYLCFIKNSITIMRDPDYCWTFKKQLTLLFQQKALRKGRIQRATKAALPQNYAFFQANTNLLFVTLIFVWYDSRVILTNQKSVYAQPATT